MQALVFGKQLFESAVGFGDVVGIARERDPAEGPAAFAERIANEGGDEAGVGEGIGHAGKLGLRAQVVAVVEGDGAPALHLKDSLDVRGDGRLHALAVGCGIVASGAR